MNIEITNDQIENNCNYSIEKNWSKTMIKINSDTILEQNQISNYITKKSITLLSFINDLYYSFNYFQILFNITNQLKNFILRFFNWFLFRFKMIFPKIKKTKSEIDNNINVKVQKITINNWYGKFIDFDSKSEQYEPFLQKNYSNCYNYLDEIQVIGEDTNINININLNFNIGIVKKKSYNNLNNFYTDEFVGEFGKIKSNYKSYNHYINSKEHIYLTPDKSWGWFIDIESLQPVKVRKI